MLDAVFYDMIARILSRSYKKHIFIQRYNLLNITCQNTSTGLVILIPDIFYIDEAQPKHISMIVNVICSAIEFKKLKSIKHINVQIAPPPFIPFSNSSSSCYLDSLVAVLLYGDNSFYRDRLFCQSTLDHLTMATAKMGSPIKDLQMLRRFAARIIQELKNLASGSSTDITVLRELLVYLVPDIKQNGSWQTYNVCEIYNVLMELVPCLSLTTRSISKRNKLESTTQLQVLDLDDIYLANEYTPVVAIQNSSDTDQSVKESICISKSKYLLVGAVVLKGNTHYVAWVVRDKKWHLYDDIGPKYSAKEFDIGNHRAELLIYQRAS
jgi:hypothetical protein